ncbi:MAG: sensor histidine kinase [Eubacteriales bacterium]|nr:sensor histidine kinase [Eubacteriales bacterium]
MAHKESLAKGPLRRIFIHNIKSLWIFLVPCIVLLLFLLNARNELDRNIVINQEVAATERAVQRFNGNMSKLASSVELMAYNSDIRALLETKTFTLSTSWINRISAIQQQITVTMLQHPFVSTVAIHAASVNYYVFQSSAYLQKESAANAMEETTLRSLETAEAEAGWYLMNGDCFYFYPVLIKNILSGSILARVNQTNLQAAMAGILPDAQHRMLLVNEQDIILADSLGSLTGQAMEQCFRYDRQESIQLITADHVSTTLSISECEITGGRLFLIAPQTQLNDQYRNTLIFLLSVTVLILGVMILLVYISAVSLCRPYQAILHLLDAPARLSNEQYNKRYRTMDNLGMIFTLIHQKNYQYMAARNELKEKEQMLSEAQNAMLLAQMDPHFLFNTLDSIHWMSVGIIGADNKVSAVICKLSQLLRISLQSTSPQTTVRKETEHARLYLEIQHIRQEYPIEIIWHVDPALLYCPILCLSLQPLLENAISHGIRNKKDGRIEISIQREGDRLCVRVTDNGAGLSPTQLSAIQERISRTDLPGEKHIGLANISCRLKLIYGEEGKMTIDSTEGEYLTVCISIPLGSSCPETTQS